MMLIFLRAIFITVLIFGCEASGKSQSANSKEETMQSYKQVNGLKMYYEVQGSGRPLVLLHGGITTIDYSFAKIRPALAKNYKTVAIEQQAHSRYRSSLDI